MLRVEEYDNGNGKYFLGDRRLLRVSEVLNLAGLSPAFWADEATRRLAAQRGTAVHRAADLLDDDRLMWSSVDPLITGFVRAYQNFRNEMGDSVHIQAREEPVYHEWYGFAGTLDRVGEYVGKPSIWDLKTSQVIERWMAIQLALYALADHRFDGAPLERVAYQRIVIQLCPDGTWRPRIFEDPHDFVTAQAAVEIARWKQRCPPA